MIRIHTLVYAVCEYAHPTELAKNWIDSNGHIFCEIVIFQQQKTMIKISWTIETLYNCFLFMEILMWSLGISRIIGKVVSLICFSKFILYKLWILGKQMRCETRFPTTRYEQPAKPQISLRICAVWSEPLLVACIYYDCSATDRTSFGLSNLKTWLHRLEVFFSSDYLWVMSPFLCFIMEC